MIRARATAAQRRVLLVDDDVISLELLALLLDYDGHQVLRAPNGEAALHLLSGVDASESPDVLLVDMQMPGISGHELARRVRALKGAKPLLLAMSATAINLQQLQGFDGFLLKPLALDDLRQALKPKKRTRVPSPAANGKRQAAHASRGSIDHAVVGKLRGAMSAQSFAELVEACISDTRSRALALKNLAHAGKPEDLRQEAHQIKGAASMIGATRVAGLAAALELGSYKREDTLPLLDDLLHACDELERMLLAGSLQKFE